MNVKSAKPFLKWAGGKRQLLDQFSNLYPEELKLGKINRYIEAFLGGGAVFFELISKYNFEQVVLNDINEELILTYRVVKEKVEDLIIELKKLESGFFSNEEQEGRAVFFTIFEKNLT